MKILPILLSAGVALTATPASANLLVETYPGYSAYCNVPPQPPLPQQAT
ncbi:hypothetical protein HY620_00300 [Candidatus Uhrbacteria bacterium]|nr:hypothetical protein [Candidatus Uhrbacteria bacterium]